MSRASRCVCCQTPRATSRMKVDRRGWNVRSDALRTRSLTTRSSGANSSSPSGHRSTSWAASTSHSSQPTALRSPTPTCPSDTSSNSTSSVSYILYRRYLVGIYLFIYYPRPRQSRGRFSPQFVCVFVCLFFCTISQKAMQLGSPNLT